jgi:sugar/nucleoside kinase (ribokinase family)
LEDIAGMLDVLPKLEKCGNVTLGLNINESNILAKLRQLPTCTAATINTLAPQLRKSLGISSIVIHSIKSCCVSSAIGGDDFISALPYCEAPKKSTGAGDRFNAGYITALLLGCDQSECLLCAIACSGCFVRAGSSPSMFDMIEFLKTVWQ